MSDPNKLQFFDDTNKSVFDLNFSIQEKPKNYSYPMSAYNNFTIAREKQEKKLHLNMAFLDMLLDNIEILPKNKNLVKAVKHLKNVLQTKCTGVMGQSYENKDYPKQFTNMPASKPLTSLEWESMVDDWKNNFFLAGNSTNVSAKFKKNSNFVDSIVSVRYSKIMYELSEKNTIFNINTEFEKEELCPLYSRNHIDKTLSFINKIGNFFDKADIYLEEIEKFQKTYETLPLTIDYLKYQSVYGFNDKRQGKTLTANGFVPDQHADIELTLKTTYGVAFESLKQAFQLVQKNLKPIHEKFVEHNLYDKKLSSKEYLGSFARTEDFEDKSKYVYLVEDRSGNVGFVGMKLNNKTSYTKISVGLVKDISKAIIFETADYNNCGISQVKESYLFQTVKPMALDFAFRPSEETFENEKMQAVANVILKKTLEKEINKMPLPTPTIANSDSEAAPVRKRHKI